MVEVDRVFCWGMEFSLLQDGSFVVSWGINETSRYSAEGRQLRRNDRDILIATDIKETSIEGGEGLLKKVKVRPSEKEDTD